MDGPYSIAHYYRIQHLQEQQMKALDRLADVAETQMKLAEKAQRSAFWWTLGSLLIAAGSLIVAIVAIVVNAP